MFQVGVKWNICESRNKIGFILLLLRAIDMIGELLAIMRLLLCRYGRGLPPRVNQTISLNLPNYLQQEKVSQIMQNLFSYSGHRVPANQELDDNVRKDPDAPKVAANQSEI